MKSHIKLAAAGLVFAAGMQIAQAQEVIIAPAQETVIREYVRSKPIASIDLPGVELNVGSPLPDTVEIHRIEAPDVAYSYTVVGNRTYVVDSDTRQVIKILD